MKDFYIDTHIVGSECYTIRGTTEAGEDRVLVTTQGTPIIYYRRTDAERQIIEEGGCIDTEFEPPTHHQMAHNIAIRNFQHFNDYLAWKKQVDGFVSTNKIADEAYECCIRELWDNWHTARDWTKP
jgi:hypothetical protein